MKTTLVLIFSTLVSLNASAYTFWTAINPYEVCHEGHSIKMLTMVNTGAGLEFHDLDRDFVSCEEENGKMILDMNLYHKSGNNMEAGYTIKRRLWLPINFCERSPEYVRFNKQADETIVANGKFSGSKMLKVKETCRKNY